MEIVNPLTSRTSVHTIPIKAAACNGHASGAGGVIDICPAMGVIVGSDPVEGNRTVVVDDLDARSGTGIFNRDVFDPDCPQAVHNVDPSKGIICSGSDVKALDDEAQVDVVDPDITGQVHHGNIIHHGADQAFQIVVKGIAQSIDGGIICVSAGFNINKAVAG